MGLFGKKLSGVSEGGTGEFNAFLGAGTEYRGRLEFGGTVRIDGTFHGEIVSDGALVLGREAVIEGQITVANLYCNGTISGEVDVRIKAVLQRQCTLQGRLKAAALVVEEGAAIEGSVEMAHGSPAMQSVESVPVDSEHTGEQPDEQSDQVGPLHAQAMESEGAPA